MMLCWKGGLLFSSLIVTIIPRKKYCDWSVESSTGLGALAMGKISAALHLAAWFIERLRETKCGAASAQKDRLSVWDLRNCIYVPRLKAQTLRLAVRRTDDFALDSLVTFWSSYHCRFDKRMAEITGKVLWPMIIQDSRPCGREWMSWINRASGGRWGSH